MLPKPVARFTRAWIETRWDRQYQRTKKVARFTRAWIETAYRPTIPSVHLVARFTRAWIETCNASERSRPRPRRPLHAGVD